MTQKTNVTVIKNADCHKTQAVYDSNFCATAPVSTGEYDRDSCRVDIESPLIKIKGDSDYAVVIIIYSFGCGRKESPMVFSRAEQVRNWIKKVAGV